MAKFLSVCVMLLGLSGSRIALAEDFFDPTRPPAALLTPQNGSAGATEHAEAPLVLQSVLRSPQRQVAIISGRSVALGQRIRGYKLIVLGNQQAELQGSQGRLTLRLVPPLHSNPVPITAKTPPHQGDIK